MGIHRGIHRCSRSRTAGASARDASSVKCSGMEMAVCGQLIGRRDRVELTAASPGIAQVAGVRARGTPSFPGSSRWPVPQENAHAFGVPDLSDSRLLRFWHDHPAGAGGERIFGVVVTDLCDDHVSWLSYRRCSVRRRSRTHGTPATDRCLSAVACKPHRLSEKIDSDSKEVPMRQTSLPALVVFLLFLS